MIYRDIDGFLREFADRGLDTVLKVLLDPRILLKAFVTGYSRDWRVYLLSSVSTVLGCLALYYFVNAPSLFNMLTVMPAGMFFVVAGVAFFALGVYLDAEALKTRSLEEAE